MIYINPATAVSQPSSRVGRSHSTRGSCSRRYVPSMPCQSSWP